MILKRKIYSKLVDWKKKSNGKTALLIEGARRVGKSTIVKEFAKANYKSFIVIDFAHVSKNIIQNFENNLIDLDIFFQRLSVQYNVQLFRRESLIIFDEIQLYPKAREAIKYLVMDGRYDFIETGSLISIKENVKNILIPSEEERITMYPLDFEEFLWALKRTQLLELIKDCFNNKTPLPKEFHFQAMDFFNQYILVGGMPQSVVAYIQNDLSFQEADIQKRNILSLYREDINKASSKYALKIASIFESIPSFLSSNNKEVTLSGLDGGRIHEDFLEAFTWLDSSMIANLCYRVNDPNIGFALTKDISRVKCYLGDTGLLFSLAFNENEITSENLYKQILGGKLSINKGMLYENVIAQMLKSQGKKLYFYTHYSKERHINDIEIDFLLSNESKTNFKVYPLEVKSSKNYTATSYEKFKIKFGNRISKSFIVHPKNLIVNENETRLPPYMLFLLSN